MIGEHTREIFKLGDSLEVEVIKVDIEDRKIDLKIVRKKTGSKKKTKKAIKKKSSKKKK
jgi:ribonuclease R